MVNIIVFLDIDGTLIDLDQKPTIHGLPELIDSFHARGVQFGLNSNRSMEDARSIIRQFHLSGPFILENGAYTLESINGQPIFFQPPSIDVPLVTKQALSSVIDKQFPGTSAEFADTTDLIKGKTMGGDGLRFFLNRFRRYSGSIHHRRNGQIDSSVPAKLAAGLNEYFRMHQINLLSVAHEHGATVTVEIPGVDKGMTLAAYRKKHPESTFVAIGDGLGDVSLRPVVDRLYAVANAVPELRAIADGVSTATMTAGVIELLQTFVRPLVERKEPAR